MKTLILILITSLLLSSCDKDKGEVICSNAEFIFVNQTGKDIFNPETLNHLNITSFEAFANDSISRLNFTDTADGVNVFYVWLYGEIEKVGTTYLKFGNITVDTILAKFEEKGNSLFISELYYNGVLIEKNESWGECGNQIHKITIK